MNKFIEALIVTPEEMCNKLTDKMRQDLHATLLDIQRILSKSEPNENNHYIITLNGERSDYIKKEVIKAYLDSGWGRVFAKNSSEEGTSGLFKLELYQSK